MTYPGRLRYLIEVDKANIAGRSAVIDHLLVGLELERGSFIEGNCRGVAISSIVYNLFQHAVTLISLTELVQKSQKYVLAINSHRKQPRKDRCFWALYYADTFDEMEEVSVLAK